MAFDPTSAAGLTGIAGIAGVGISLFGSAMALPYEEKIASDQSQVAGQSQNIATAEQAINTQKNLQMNLNTQRSQMENLRNMQRTQAAGVAGATAGGAQFGSGLGGLFGAIAGSGGQNTRNLSQNQQIGNAIYGDVGQENTAKFNIAGLQGDIASNQGQASIWQGIASAGGSIAGGAGSFGKLFGQSS